MTEAPTFNCSVCGAPAQTGDVSCRFCGAGIATLRCGNCFQLNMAEARRCSVCGEELGQAAESSLLGKQCSDCHAALEALREPAGAVLACSRCGGLFVEHSLLRSLLEQYERTGLAFPDAPYHKLVAKGALTRVRYRPCSICDQMMNRRNFGGASGVIVDVCAKHGTWFDAGELPQVLEFVKSGGLVRERVRAEERQREAFPRDSCAGELTPPHSFESSSLRAQWSATASFASEFWEFVVEVLKPR